MDKIHRQTPYKNTKNNIVIHLLLTEKYLDEIIKIKKIKTEKNRPIIQAIHIYIYSLENRKQTPSIYDFRFEIFRRKNIRT